MEHAFLLRNLLGRNKTEPPISESLFNAGLVLLPHPNLEHLDGFLLRNPNPSNALPHRRGGMRDGGIKASEGKKEAERP